MHWFWKRISSRDDALRIIRYSSNVFFALAAMQFGVAAFILFSSSSARSYAALPADAVFNYVATAIIIAALAGVLRSYNSRLSAVALLLLSAAITTLSLSSMSTRTPAPGNLALAIIAVLVALRATQATFNLHDGFAEEIPPTEEPPKQEPRKPTADFVSHPKAGVESTKATTAASAPTKPYDHEKWAALLKYDDDIALVAGRISHLGQRWLDELAHDYLALNDKQYLRKIEEKIYAEARAQRARSRL